MVRIKYFLLRIIDYFIGHDWAEWGVFSYVPEGGAGFATMTDRNSRQCDRCYFREYKDWSDIEQVQLADMQRRSMSRFDGYFGSISGVRFYETVDMNGNTGVDDAVNRKEIKKAVRTLRKHRVK